jgi:hypothetical protein
MGARLPDRTLVTSLCSEGQRLATTLALMKYDPKEHPGDLACQYDKAQRSPAPAPAKKRSK